MLFVGPCSDGDTPKASLIELINANGASAGGSGKRAFDPSMLSVSFKSTPDGSETQSGNFKVMLKMTGVPPIPGQPMVRFE